MNRSMIRWMPAAAALCATIGCSVSPVNPVLHPVSAEAFVGTWRSVTPSYEFIGLSVVSKSSEIGVLGARLTLSGVAWEGGGRIDGDSLVASMTVSGAPTANAAIVAHAKDAQTLRVRFGSAAAPAIDLTFVREP
jgi:hypothetical protein